MATETKGSTQATPLGTVPPPNGDLPTSRQSSSFPGDPWSALMPLSKGKGGEERRLKQLLDAHERWRARDCLNLLASENLSSPTVQRYLASDLSRRYTLPLDQMLHGEKVDNGYAGTRYTDQVEELASRATGRLLHGKFASVRPLSGHVASMCVLAPLLPKGARYLAVQPVDGGYDGYAPGYLPAVLGHEVLPLPLHGPTHRLDVEEVSELLHRDRPQALVLGQSFVLFPYPLKEVAKIAHEVGALVLYDASHVMGLIMGGTFQDPLGEGADVVFGSTHKSLFGPQGGLFATDREDLFQQIDAALTWRILDNAHWNRIAGLAQALLETERVGAPYASRVVENSKALAKALDQEEVPVIGKDEGYTESHQVHLDGEELKRKFGVAPPGFARRLEAQNLIIDLVGRLGTAEATRLGLKPKDMPKVARLIKESGLDRKDVRREIAAFRHRYRGMAFL
ncbi:MAG: serine hydroxymethyltransferase [Euryarchaeota archaeon]|nr:serine hydroxymethyltransferase [Euryarchaeota archaeon]MDE1836089.1 serine hydroxymethyltransferase [Euryarchaeota archaeon]MDE1879379.1 serine hydroxymethyltransferase [Euryarchaeota archaeon]MDE2044067.1 serine hydroxymethyltransferase [Thermoplasmata archaeon]